VAAPRARIRLGLPSDLGAVTHLCAALWPDEPAADHKAHAARILSSKPASTMPLVIIVAEVDADIVGFLEVGLRSHADGCDVRHPVGFIEGWYVQPNHQRRGVGRALVAAAEDWARSQGVRELASDTWIDHETSQRAHEALGFEVVDRCVHFRKSLAFTYTHVAQLVGLHNEWHGRGFERCEFELRTFGLDDALALRTCWPPCDPFSSGKVTHDGDGRAIRPQAPSSPMIPIMACSKSVLDMMWPEKYRPVAVPGESLVVMDGNHRLANLAVRRAQGHRDDPEIEVYFCRAVASAALTDV
jgi:aminoglycoside 6'-N-acetyltransferase I